MQLIKNRQIVNIMLQIFYISGRTVTLFHSASLQYKGVPTNLLMKKSYCIKYFQYIKFKNPER